MHTPGRAVTADEGIRDDLTGAELAAKRPAFRAGGTVTGGNSSPLNDGAAGLLLMSERAVTTAVGASRWPGTPVRPAPGCTLTTWASGQFRR